VPFGEVLRYMGRNWQAILCHHLAFSLLAVFNFGLGAWLYEFMSRTHGWKPGNIGLLFGLNVMIAGALGIVAGGWLADRLAARGVRDANLRVGLIAAVAFFPTNGLFPLVDNDVLAYLLTVPGSFFLALPGGAAAAAVQEIMPNPMRGQASAIYLFVINLVGMGLGPSAVAWVTDGWFGDEMMLRYSLVIVGVTAHVLALAALLLGLKPYRRSLEMVEEWSAKRG
jgi:nitrate/nitrite transporter NarK